ncbi:MAG TPA: FadR/GntR family transcriptional regulator [Desulfuromonadales bacterium]|nr:FadR/GntR family transcriptional regulator [Desulfuromonadales bacterium]
MPFQPIKLKKVANQIADQIRNSILNGEFAPGEKLPAERELVKIFGVSRPSVREALNILESSGMVSKYQGGGTVVMSLVDAPAAHPLRELIRLEKDRAMDVIEVRMCVESWTSYYAAQRALPADIRDMDEIIDKMRRNLGEKHPSEVLDANLHVIIARATHNILWMHLMQNLFDAFQEFQQSVWRAVYLTLDDHHLLLEHHSRIIEAIKAKDPEGARQAMMLHLEFAEKRSAAYIAQQK